MLAVWRRFVITRSERGQLVIPALFFFPTLMLFVYLLFETAKLSRAKIRHQFAIDAAAFVEMTNYSDFLNRSAYVNGPFPMRIMHEGFHETKQNCRFRTPCNGNDVPSDDLMFDDGAFPRDGDTSMDHVDATTNHPMDNNQNWTIEYGGGRAGLVNRDDPSMQTWDTSPVSPCQGDCGLVFSQQSAQHYNIGWEDATTIFKMYIQIYQLLGSVESAQFAVLRRLTDGSNHNFLSKSYWLNADQSSEALGDAQRDLVPGFNASSSLFVPSVKFHCEPKMRLYGNKFTHDMGVYEPAYEEYPMPSTIGECGGPGLFQIVTVKPNVIQSMMAGVGSSNFGSRGWPLEVHWTAPDNYFNVDVNGIMRTIDQGPKVHASVSMYDQGGRAKVWPRPNPKYQVRLYP
jgi:hypothetical protein